MTTEPAPHVWSAAPAARAPRRLWQVPVFVAGLLALGAVWLGRPLWHETPVDKLERALAAVRDVLAAPDGDGERAVALAEEALRQAETLPARRGAAHYLLGSAYLRQAEQSPQDEAACLWGLARDHLEQAETLGVPETEQLRLVYRLGKAGFHSGDDPVRVVARLGHAIEHGDDPADGLQMLAEACLRLPEPNLAGALEATDKRLALPTNDPNRLAQIRLFRGELLLRMGRAEEARRTLERIRPGAPPTLVFRARLLRARSLQADGLWKEAAALWQELQADHRDAPDELGHILYNLGLCHRQTGQALQAIHVWEQGRLCGGDEGQAAAFALAELRLQGHTPALALEALHGALRSVASPQDFQNRLIDRAEARRITEHGWQVYRDAGDYDHALRLARLYARLAAPGRDQELIAQTADVWATVLEEQARRAGDAAAARPDAEEARRQWRLAARAYAAAGQVGEPAQQAERLWLSADRCFRAGDYADAVPVLQRYLDLKLSADKLAEGWFVLGEAYRSLKDAERAGEAYRWCIQCARASPAIAYRARYQLALADIAADKLDKAETILQEILEMLRQAPEEDAQERTLYTLGALLVRRDKYALAEPHLRKALERYPNNPQAVRARYQLAYCCGKLADTYKGNGSEPTEHQVFLGAQHRLWLTRAAESYQKVAAELDRTRPEGAH